MFLGLVTGSCSILEPTDDRIKVTNTTEVPIVFYAFDLEASHLVDLAIDPISVEESEILPPNASRAIQPSEVSGEYSTGRDLRLFVYEVSGEYGVYRSMLTITAEELRRSGFRIFLEGS